MQQYKPGVTGALPLPLPATPLAAGALLAGQVGSRTHLKASAPVAGEGLVVAVAHHQQHHRDGHVDRHYERRNHGQLGPRVGVAGLAGEECVEVRHGANVCLRAPPREVWLIFRT